MAVIFKRQTKLFPNIKDRIGLNEYIAPPPKPSTSEIVKTAALSTMESAKESLLDAFKWLEETVAVMGPPDSSKPGPPDSSKPELDAKKADFYFGSMPRKYFEIFKKYGYIAATTAATYTAGAIFIIFDGVKWVVKSSFFALVDSFRKIKAKGFMKSLVDVFSKKPELLKMTPEEIFDSLPDAVKKDLESKGYTRYSPEFAALARALSHGLRKCDEEDCIKSLESGNDRFALKLKLEGILRKLDLNAEDEFAKFRKKVVEILSEQFSLFAKFQQKVIEELYRIGIPQIPEITPDFFQILNEDEHNKDLEEMRDVYSKFDYDKI